MREGAFSGKFAARVPHADFVDIVDGKGGAAPAARPMLQKGDKMYLSSRTRIDIIDKFGKAASCKA